MKRNLFLRRLLLSFFIATFLFVVLFSLARTASYWSYERLRDHTNELALSVEALEKARASFSCNSSLLLTSSNLFDRAATKLTLLEKRFGKADERVLEQKRIYSNLQYAHYLLARQFMTECSSDLRLFFFFYSNRNGMLQAESERMGFILTAFERGDPHSVIIYSFDKDLSSPVVDVLLEQYAISSVPIVVTPNGSLVSVTSLSDLNLYR